MAGAKSKILVVGATGYLGKFIVAASARSGHPTFALVRDAAPSDASKATTVEGFKSSGVSLLEGDLSDHESLVKALRQVDVVISAVGSFHVEEQLKLIAVIKEVGTIKRFVPSDFGLDVDRAHPVQPAASMLYAPKIRVRRAVEAEEIPYTIVSCNCLAMHALPVLAQAEAMAPPTDKVVILGDGNAKAVFVTEEDVATYTIKAVDDPRTLNKILYLRPPANIYSINELVSLWDRKTGKELERIYTSEEDTMKKIEGASFPTNLYLAVSYSIFVEGDNTNFVIEPSLGVEATVLYPDVKYTTVDGCLDRIIQG